MDFADVFKAEFKLDVADFHVRPDWTKLKDPGDAGNHCIHYLYSWLTARGLYDVKFD